MPKTSAPKRRPISLALQGGGSHGAFQWGVLDRLLEDDRLDIRAVTAASAGAMNAAALITGLAKGGAEGARAQLDLLWREVNQAGGRNVFGASAGGAPSWLKESAAWRAGESLALDLHITDELRRAGTAREIVRAIQDARKGAGFEVTDRITVRWSSADDDVRRSITEHADAIAGEVLAESFAEGPGLTIEVSVPDTDLALSISRA